jgi:hypothetical protein
MQVGVVLHRLEFAVNPTPDLFEGKEHDARRRVNRRQGGGLVQTAA